MIDFLVGALVSLPLAVAVWYRQRVTAAGAVVGVLCAGAIYAGMYLAGLAVLLVALVLTLVSSHIGDDRKTALGIAEAHGGRRGAANILANCGVGSAIALLEALQLGWGTPVHNVAFVAAIAAGASDTVASEIGKAWDARPRSFPSFRAVAAGTAGAISIAGTIAGIVAAAIIALPAAGLWLIAYGAVLPIALACTVAALLESAVGTVAGASIVSNTHVRNTINTAAAALVAAWLAA